ncbi:putative aminotransferase tcpI [Paramyrothecium foliicola]|nr:putative aminotransferase tcpI [Paramyrothecium foliicola]
MLSLPCKQRNETLIPSLMNQHKAVLTGDATTVDLSTAENWAVKQTVLERVQTALTDLQEEDLAYASGVGGCSKTRKLIAELLNAHFRPAQTVDPSHVVLAAGGSFALTALVEQICDPGDGILIAAPYWAGLDISISVHCHARVVPVHAPLGQFFDPESVSHYEESLKQSPVPIKAVLICNPHNPLGQCYPRETLKAMMDFCSRHGLHYISDEVYALSAHRAGRGGNDSFVSALEAADDAIKDQLHVIYSLSKDFGCNGIRLGALVTQSNEAVRMSAALSVHSQVSSLSTALASKAVLTPQAIGLITQFSSEKLGEAYKLISSFLDSKGIEYIPAGYGMFVFARLHKVANVDEERELYRSFQSKGVSLSTGTSYHFNEPGWFRICYGVPLAQLQEGLRRIEWGIQSYLASPN